MPTSWVPIIALSVSILCNAQAYACMVRRPKRASAIYIILSALAAAREFCRRLRKFSQGLDGQHRPREIALHGCRFGNPLQESKLKIPYLAGKCFPCPRTPCAFLKSSRRVARTRRNIFIHFMHHSLGSTSLHYTVPREHCQYLLERVKSAAAMIKKTVIHRCLCKCPLHVLYMRYTYVRIHIA